MADLKKKHICVKFCFSLERTTSQAHEINRTAFGDNSFDRTQTIEWVSRLKLGENSVENTELLKRPSTGLFLTARASFVAKLSLQAKWLTQHYARWFSHFCGACSQKTSGKMAEPGLFACHDNVPTHSLWYVQHSWPLKICFRFSALLTRLLSS